MFVYLQVFIKEVKEENSITLSQAQEPNQAKLTWRVKVNHDNNTRQIDTSPINNIAMKGIIYLEKLLDQRLPYPKYFDYLISQTNQLRVTLHNIIICDDKEIKRILIDNTL